MKDIRILAVILAVFFSVQASSVFAKENPRERGKAKQERFQKWEAENPKEAKRYHKLAKDHPEAARWYYIETRKAPQNASQLYKEAKRNPSLAKSIYENSVKQDRSKYKLRRTAKVMRKHRGLPEESRKHKMHRQHKPKHDKKAIDVEK